MRKILAVITATALVASMSNFQAFAAGEGSAEESVPETVIVDFNIGEGLKVLAADKTLRDSASLEVSTQRTFEFEVASTGSKPFLVDSVSAVQKELPLGAPLEHAAPASAAEPANATEASAVFASPDISANESSPVTEDAAADPEAEPAAEDTVDETASTVDPANSEEPIADNATPQAPTPASQNEEEGPAVEVEVGYDPTTGIYTIDQENLQKAATANCKIVVTVTSRANERVEEAGDWNTLKTLLELPSEEQQIVALSQDITLEEINDSLVIKPKGQKRLELAGHHIYVRGKNIKASLVEVGDGASLIIADAASEQVKRQATGTEETTSSQKYADQDIAKLATYDASQKKLVYYVTASEPNRATGTTTEIRDTYEVDFTLAGSIEAEQLDSLVAVTGGDVSVLGGLFTNKGGRHGIKVTDTTKAKKVTIDGGFIMGCGADAHGAGIYFEGKSSLSSFLTIAGSSIIGGNVTDARYNGGGIWVKNAALLVEEKALIVGNKASAGADDKTQVEKGRVEVNNGGGIYVYENAEAIIEDEAVVAGNRAAADGGGIYVRATKANTATNPQVPSNKLTLSGDALITNNVASHNLTGIHQKNVRVYQDYLGGGGGGIFTHADTVINGGQITANYACEGGGGIFMPGEPYYVKPTLNIDYIVVAGNACGTSEGGGMAVMPKSGSESHMRKGYITNNATMTSFDYGGGGLFVPAGGEFELRNPLVTKNLADGWGGGVAACTNGTVITSDAAIFDNHANQVDHTTNPVEWGDLWAVDPAYVGLPEGASDDYFCAKESSVYNNMLGGGFYNWDGYMSGQTTNKAVFNFTKFGNPLQNTVTVTLPSGATEQLNFYSGHFEKDSRDGVLKGYAYFPSNMNWDTLNGLLLHAYCSFTGSQYGSRQGTTGVIENIEKIANDSVKYNTVSYCKYYFTMNLTIKTQPVEGGVLYTDDDESATASNAVRWYKAFTAEYTTNSALKTYNVYQILPNKFPVDGHANASRFMALTAHPYLGQNNAQGRAAAIQAAFDNASIFISGNYSDNNGGGIACNGHLVIGKNPKDPNPDTPKLEEDEFDLTLTKAWANLDQFNPEENGSLTTAFRIRAYRSEGIAATQPENYLFETVVGMTFDKSSDDQQSRVISNLKKGWYVVVEELAVDGDNFTASTVVKGQKIKGNHTVVFKNTYDPEGSYTTGVVNSYAKGDDGKVQVTQDDLYQRRPHSEGSGTTGRNDMSLLTGTHFELFGN